MSQYTVKIEDVSFAYEVQPVLKDIDLKMKSGEFLGILGPNGSGKSTLVKLILNLLKPQKGNIEVFGQPVQSLKDRSSIGYVSQKANSFQRGFPATVKEVVASGLYGKLGLFRWMKKKDFEQVDQAIEQVGLTPFAKSNIGSLSGGQQQRAFIARALVSKPKLLIFDEPTVGVDTKSVSEFYDLIKKLHQQEQLTLLLVTHDIYSALSYVDRVVCLNKQLIFDGDKEAFIRQDKEILSRVFGDVQGTPYLHYR
ncbi:metal ABC transporter ATP-binding protein [Thermoflavimicrobium daqui]|jgi:zinc transport system ATP-binding protein|uniref:Zinc ABC transporter ATP-binding protein n=1 Tax=Thermoflavimicrobium daqui TaxID=2137476 RepID=A0A364K3Z5_9BACL|nr:metal ABC transporter ATP-binding protein [Thermoflavimicrobium daqui]RAL23446.1 zinc ABC transporter ATP-binding protein [Thermoflavimicrobium daqui]